MEKTLDTFYFGEVTLSNSGEGYIEVIDSNDRVIAKIYGYSIDDVDEDVIEDNLL